MTIATTAEQTGALLGVYKQPAVSFVGGHGCWLTADDGREYLDFTSGIAVNALGYGDADVTAAIQQSLASGLVHTSNLYRTRPGAELAEWLAAHSFADKVFFCNSGAEANEGAIKFARKLARAEGHEHRTQIVAFRGGFHGRTMGALAATDRPGYQAPFRPLMPGVQFCEVGNVAEVEEALSTGRVAAVLIEPLQAEGGVLPVPAAFLKALRYLCDEAGALLVFDEVQSGLGRTGYLWAHEAAGVAPDVMTIAKPLAGGLPMGAVLMTERVAAALQPGDHGTTFGGGPLVASAALATCRKIGGDGFLEAVRQRGQTLANRLGGMSMRHAGIKAVRGAGMIWGIELEGSAGDVVSRALDAGLLICSAGPNVVRLLPPLIASDEELTRGVDILDEVL
jgi:predicted acetylornithine/succinylornithine family transaminase